METGAIYNTMLEFYNNLWVLGTELSHWPASLCSLAGRSDNPIPTRFLALIDRYKIRALILSRFAFKNDSRESIDTDKTKPAIKANIVGSAS